MGNQEDQFCLILFDHSVKSSWMLSPSNMLYEPNDIWKFGDLC